MLPKQYRLPGWMIQDIFRHGMKRFSPEVDILWLPSTLPYPQFSVVVPVRVAKKATQRNRLKRLFREALRSMADTVEPCYMVVKVKSKTIDSSETAKTYLEKILSESGNKHVHIS